MDQHDRRLGAGRIVSEDYNYLDVKLDYSADNTFAAWDRFGRVVDQVWTDYGANPDVVLDEYTYTYDRAGNRTSRDNELNHDLDETYNYDLIDRLVSAVRDNGFDQTWGLDGLGNFSAFDDDGDSQTRTTNEANEIESITGGWISPSYDDAGNMISGPKPGDETTRQHYVYDAWNRLVAAYEDDGDGVFEPGTDDTLLAGHKYDGLNRRIKKTDDSGWGHHYYYNRDWQIVDDRTVNDWEVVQSIDQYVWSSRYVDSPVVCLHDGGDGYGGAPDGDVSDDYPTDWRRYYTTDANHNVTTTIRVDNTNYVRNVSRNVYTAYGSVSANTGRALWLRIALYVAMNVKGETMTSSPASTPMTCKLVISAVVPLAVPRQRFAPSKLA